MLYILSLLCCIRHYDPYNAYTQLAVYQRAITPRDIMAKGCLRKGRMDSEDLKQKKRWTAALNPGIST